MNTHEYITKLQTQVDQLAVEIRNLKARAQQLSSDARSTYENKIIELQKRRDQLQRRMEMIQDIAVI